MLHIVLPHLHELLLHCLSHLASLLRAKLTNFNLIIGLLVTIFATLLLGKELIPQRLQLHLVLDSHLLGLLEALLPDSINFS